MRRKKELKALAQHLMFGKPSRNFNMNDWPTCAIGEGVKRNLLPGMKLKLTGAGTGTPIFKNESGIDAVCTYFDIDCYEGERLFGGGNGREAFEEGSVIAQFLKEEDAL